MHAFHESPDCKSLTSHVLTLKAHITKIVCFCCLLTHIEASLSNSVDPDETAPIGAVSSGSTLFASLLMLNNKHAFSNIVSLNDCLY